MTQARKEAVGAYGERVAAAHLRAQGMAVLSTNWRCKYGEVDIVARDGNTLVICEVKTRTSVAHGSGVEGVTGQKAARLRRLAAHWLEIHRVEPEAVRIEVLSVLVPKRGRAEVERIVGVS
jgi:putative endonuclease